MKPDRARLSFLKTALADEIERNSQVMAFEKGTELLRAGQYIKVLPIVLSGLIKVSSRYDDKELLLYYLEPEESCIMTFHAALKSEPSKVHATAEEDSEVLLIPAHLLPGWTRSYPELNELFFAQYNLRYADLIDTIGHLLLDRMDKRIYDYVLKKSGLTQSDSVKTSHSQIAAELGTAREVVTRILKKLESEGKIVQGREGIRISNPW